MFFVFTTVTVDVKLNYFLLVSATSIVGFEVNYSQDITFTIMIHLAICIL